MTAPTAAASLAGFGSSVMRVKFDGLHHFREGHSGHLVDFSYDSCRGCIEHADRSPSSKEVEPSQVPDMTVSGTCMASSLEDGILSCGVLIPGDPWQLSNYEEPLHIYALTPLALGRRRESRPPHWEGGAK